jgi:predicted cupin superfamily sugar epimerase
MRLALLLVVLQKTAAMELGQIPDAALAWVKALDLQKQPFGNFMRENPDSQWEVHGLPAQFPGGTRAISGNIYNLLAVDPRDPSLSQGGFPLHMMEGDEVYHYYAGDGPLLLFDFDWSTGDVTNTSVGAMVPGRDTPQYVIANGSWSGALLAEGSTWVLTGAPPVHASIPHPMHLTQRGPTQVPKQRPLGTREIRTWLRATPPACACSTNASRSTPPSSAASPPFEARCPLVPRCPATTVCIMQASHPRPVRCVVHFNTARCHWGVQCCTVTSCSSTSRHHRFPERLTATQHASPRGPRSRYDGPVWVVGDVRHGRGRLFIM